MDYLDNLSKTLENLLDNIERAQRRQADFVNQHRREVPFKVGDRVWLSTKNLQTQRPSKKLDYKRIGPYKITKQVNPVAFELLLPLELRIHNVFHSSLLSPYVENEFDDREEPPPAPILVNDEL